MSDYLKKKKVLMIHHLNMEKIIFLQSNYERYSELTFDDALLSQFYFAPLLKDLPIEKTIFVAPGLLNKNTSEVRNQYPNEPPIMKNERLSLRSGDSSLYMSEKEIRTLHDAFGYSIGAHSYYHSYVYVGGKHFSRQLVDHRFMGEDSKLVRDWMLKNNYGDKFCFPFNQSNESYIECLKELGFEKFYGYERIGLEDEMLKRC